MLGDVDLVVGLLHCTWIGSAYELSYYSCAYQPKWEYLVNGVLS